MRKATGAKAHIMIVLPNTEGGVYRSIVENAKAYTDLYNVKQSPSRAIERFLHDKLSIITKNTELLKSEKIRLESEIEKATKKIMSTIEK